MRSWARGLALCEDLLAVTTIDSSRRVGVKSMRATDTPEAGAHVGTPASNKPDNQAVVSAWRAIASSSLVGKK